LKQKFKEDREGEREAVKLWLPRKERSYWSTCQRFKMMTIFSIKISKRNIFLQYHFVVQK